eukprot:6180541-Pleurochrysis_carterae.AAC.2
MNAPILGVKGEKTYDKFVNAPHLIVVSLAHAPRSHRVSAELEYDSRLQIAKALEQARALLRWKRQQRLRDA